MEPCATTDLALGQADADTLQLITGMQALEQAEQLAGALHDKARVVVVYEKRWLEAPRTNN